MKKETKTKKVKETTKELEFKDTSEIKVPKTLIEQVIGQETSISLIRKAAYQKRHILLIGEPGTGKSMIAAALAETLPPYQLKDILSYPNPEDSHNPIIKVVNAGEGKKIIDNSKLQAMKSMSSQRILSFVLPMGWLILSVVLWQFKVISDTVFGAMLILSGFIMIATALSYR